MPSPHYDVEKGSLSDNPSDLNHLRTVTKQFHRTLMTTIKRFREDLSYLEGLATRMEELSEKAYQKHENS